MVETVGFIGLGHMGDGMSRRLLKVAGKKLVIWNRSAAKAKALESEAPSMVTVAATPAAVIKACAVTYVMLSEPTAVKAVYEMTDGVLAGVGPGKSIVDCATLAVADMERLSGQVLAKGGRFLEAPVSGSKAPAAQGMLAGALQPTIPARVPGQTTDPLSGAWAALLRPGRCHATGQLIFLASGDEELYNECAVDLDAMGKAKFFFGKVGGGTRVKLAVNMVTPRGIQPHSPQQSCVPIHGSRDFMSGGTRVSGGTCGAGCPFWCPF